MSTRDRTYSDRQASLGRKVVKQQRSAMFYIGFFIILSGLGLIIWNATSFKQTDMYIVPGIFMFIGLMIFILSFDNSDIDKETAIRTAESYQYQMELARRRQMIEQIEWERDQLDPNWRNRYRRGGHCHRRGHNHHDGQIVIDI